MENAESHIYDIGLIIHTDENSLLATEKINNETIQLKNYMQKKMVEFTTDFLSNKQKSLL